MDTEKLLIDTLKFTFNTLMLLGAVRIFYGVFDNTFVEFISWIGVGMLGFRLVDVISYK